MNVWKVECEHGFRQTKHGKINWRGRMSGYVITDGCAVKDVADAMTGEQLAIRIITAEWCGETLNQVSDEVDRRRMR